ncbi:MAG: AraC family transcriptional regulator [Bacillota bacterium]
MEWLNRLRDSIDYLEEHMESKIDMDAAAKIALSSKFHFQRMFHMTTGVTVAEYVRKRRLTLAAQELTTSDAKVIDVALKYGYQTPEAFTKAFQKIHGVNPSEARDLGINLKAYPRISFQIQIKGEKAMNYRIVEKDAFKIVGKSKRVTTVDGKNFQIIPEFWEEANNTGLCEQLCKFQGSLGLLGVCMDFDHEKEALTYVIAVEKPQIEVPDDLVEKEIPAATWAIFESVGPMPKAIQDVWERIFSEWFPATGYEHANAPELEVYLPGNPNDDDYKCEVWIPIIKK